MRDYQKEYKEHQVRCVVCKQAWIPHARHVDTDGMVKDCRPDNLRWLEYLDKQKNG